MKKKIVIADTQFLIIEAFKQVLSECGNYEISGIATNYKDLKNIPGLVTCQLLITDIQLMDFQRLEDLQLLMKDNPGLTILAISNQLNKNDINEYSKAGIKNIILKTAEKEEILNAIEAALKGRKYFCSEVLDILLENQDKRTGTGILPLSVSEIEIVRQIAEGLTTKEIAEKKNLSFHTVMTHRKNIFRKTGVRSTSELLMYAMRNGFFDLEYYI